MRTVSLLEEAAKRGCDVRLLYDSVGSWQIEERHVAALRAAGGVARAFHPLQRDWAWRWSFYLYRNHRKTLCVDDDLAYCGGMNVGGQYCSPAIGGTSYFSDVHVKIVGPASADMREVFLDSMHEANKHIWQASDHSAPVTWKRKLVQIKTRWLNPNKESESKKKSRPPIDEVVGRNSLVQVLVSNVRREKMHIQRALPLAIRNSRIRCFIASPYFLPPKRVRDALIDAAMRGVDVRIVTAGRTDVTLAKYAGRHLYSLFLKYGVKVYEMKQSALHAKVCLLDDVYTTIGSFNMDVLSHTRNLEVSMHVLDPHLGVAARTQLEFYMQGSKQVTNEDLQRRTWWQKVMHWCAYQVARLPQVYRSAAIDDVS